MLATAHELEVAAGRALVEHVFGGCPTENFAVRLWDGSEVRWGSRRDFTMVFHDKSTFASLLLSHDPSAFAEAYVDGRLDIDGDVDAAVRLASSLRTRGHDGTLHLPASLHHVAQRLRTHVADARDVRAHYDLSDAFFRLFLDRRMVYSCAFFASREEALEVAQERKLDLICRKLKLRPSDEFLDVGCGWGALVLWAAQHYGVRATGITLSIHQAEAARASIARAGLSERATIQLRHYEDLPAAAFDKVASIGMIEHVGVSKYGRYFAALERALRPGGLLLNHGITRPPAPPGHNGGEFMLGRIFPGAEIDVLSHTLSVMEEHAFEVLSVQSLRPHYALTLGAWEQRYRAHRAEAARLVPERVLRAWDLYLPGCRRAFAEDVVSVHQCFAAKPAGVGTSRDYLASANAQPFSVS